jgi:hypothetical protein
MSEDSSLLRDQNNGAHLIACERTRQWMSTGGEGYSYAHDDEHTGGELLAAALVYGRCAMTSINGDSPHAAAPVGPPTDWPFEPEAFRPKWSAPIDCLIKAGALIAAEIDRLQRASA